MKIIFEGTYKSLSSFQSDELTDLCIITGKNGSGKSQLVDLIKFKQSKNEHVQVNLDPALERIQVEGLGIEALGSFSHQNWRDRVQELLRPYLSYGDGYLKIMEVLLANNFDFERLKKKHLTVVLAEMTEGKIDLMAQAYRLQFPGQQASGYELHVFGDNLHQSIVNLRSTEISFLKYISDNTGKPVGSLSASDFYAGEIPERFVDATDLFSSRIETIFYAYAKRRAVNDFKYYKKNSGRLNDAIPDAEFITRFPPPWTVINRILEKYKIKYRFQEMVFDLHETDAVFEYKLQKTGTDIEVVVADLSSGEKIIIGLILKLFHSRYYEQDLKFPELIVLDEPDAYLHPEMSKLLLDVLYQTFVKEMKIKIVFTTHSPSTIAVTPDECIYELRNEPVTRLKKITKDDALKILTQNIPTLSIDYKSHRQVFVESPTDQGYYQTMFAKIKATEKPIFNLYFITAANGKGNADQVVRITTDIRKSGNTTAFGIIDWDLSKTGKEYVLVHGKDSRYSIENFMLDPLYLAVLFLEQGVKNGIDELGFDNTFDQYSIGDQPAEKLQQIADWVVQRFIKKFPALKYENLVRIAYLNGKAIQIPSWFVLTKGHDLVLQLRKVFLSLNQFRSETELQQKLTEIIAKCYPLIPLETYNLLNELARITNAEQSKI